MSAKLAKEEAKPAKSHKDQKANVDGMIEASISPKNRDQPLVINMESCKGVQEDMSFDSVSASL